jgi:alkylation response protein AidB-like acyl-CoA dehydrogenase
MFAAPEGFDRSLWKQLAAELGLQGIHLPESVGGQGFGFLELGIVLEEMGAALPFFASSVLAAETIRCVASGEEQRALLPASPRARRSRRWPGSRRGQADPRRSLEARPEGSATGSTA